MAMHGVALSRASGCVVALKIVADVADGAWSVDSHDVDIDIVVPEILWEGRPFVYRQRPMAAPAASLDAEADLYGPRAEIVRAYGAANRLDVVEIDPPKATIGIAATGTTFDSVRQALADLGADDFALHHAGIRLLRIGMPTPLGPDTVTTFAGGLDEILVVEDKTAFVETQMREILYGRTGAPRIIGKKDADRTAADPRRRRIDGRSAAGAAAARAQGSTGTQEAAATGAVAGSASRTTRRVLLQRLPAQPLDRGARRIAGRRRHRLPHHGDDVGTQGQRRHRAHPDGRRGQPVDRPGPVHRRPAPVPEHRRRNLLPLRPTRRAGLRRRGRQHHLQAAVQRGGGDDRRPERRGRTHRRRADPQTDRRGRQADHRLRRRTQAAPTGVPSPRARSSGTATVSTRPRSVCATSRA